MATKVPFTVHAGEPIAIEVRARDGHTYVAKVTLAVFEATEKDERNPVTALPDFDFRANIVVDVQPKP